MMTTEEWNDKPTGSNNGRTIIGQTAIDAEKDATIARLTAELAEARERQQQDVKINDQIAADVVKWNRRAEAAEARIDELETALTRREAMHKYAMAERDDATLYADEQKARAEAAEAERDALIGAAYEARPALTVPMDGTIVRLLLDYTGEENWTPLEDEMQAWTIGYNTLADTGEDEWIIVGWNWSQDCWCEGSGNIIGWLPFVPEAPTDATAALDRIKAEAELAGWKRGRDDAAEYHKDRATEVGALASKYRGGSIPWFERVERARVHNACASAIRALTPPADLAARIAKEAGNE